MAAKSTSDQSLHAENAELRARLAEQDEMLRAIRSGEIDALVVETHAGPRVFTLQGADADSSRFRGEVLAQVGDAVVAIDEDERVTYLNSAAERLYGVTASEALGRRESEIYQTRWLGSGGRSAALDALRERGEWRGQSIHVLPDGRTFRVASSLTPLRDRDGSAIGRLAVIRDITEEQHTHALLDTLLRTAPVGFCFLDRELRYVRINEWLAKINGYPMEAHVGRSVAEMVPTLAQSVRDVTEKILATGEAVLDVPFAGETVAAPGVEREWIESWYPVRDVRGDEIVGFGVVVEEITARKKSEEAVRTSQQQLRAIFDGTPEYIALITPDGRLCDVNRTALEFAQVRREDVVGQWFWETVWFRHTPGMPELVRQAIARAAAGESVHFQTPIIAPDGRQGIYDLSFRPIRDPNGDVVFIVPAALDITERDEMEQALRDADRRKDEFLATLAHELRNPLAPVRSAVELLRLKSTDVPELQWARDVIDRQVQQMTRLIDDLLDVSRISRGKIELKRERIELAKVVWGAVETSRPLIEQLGHTLNVSLPPDPVILEADLTRLSQVFLNLLNNAAKYTERRGQIWLSAERKEGGVTVSVRDTGVGIPAANLPGIFEMFSQVEGVLSRSQGGLGIGLSLARRLVEMHGGRIEARSDGPGRGSEFRVHLPIAPKIATTAGASRADERERPMPASALRVLVVDDNRDAAESTVLLLKMMGNEVRMAHDGESALQMAAALLPQVVLLDIGLPKLNGYDVAIRIRKEPWGRDMHLIAVTGWGHETDARRSEEAGFDRHLVKPVDPRALMRLVASLSPA